MIKGKHMAGYPQSQFTGFHFTSHSKPADPHSPTAATATSRQQQKTAMQTQQLCLGHMGHVERGGRALNNQHGLQGHTVAGVGVNTATTAADGASEHPHEAVEKLHEQLKYVDIIGEGSVSTLSSMCHFNV
jgi:pyruvate/2-oxoglutarate dehydrogenase complex dihydrolipoamide acyltransferase (E2) component